jgi:hypothetical protein
LVALGQPTIGKQATNKKNNGRMYPPMTYVIPQRREGDLVAKEKVQQQELVSPWVGHVDPPTSAALLQWRKRTDKKSTKSS